MERNVVGWFEIPVIDMERAIQFYETVFEFKMDHRPTNGFDMAWFPMASDRPGAGGALVKHEQWYQPSMQGVLIYLTAHSGDLSNELGRVEEAGGHVLQPKKSIGEWGFMAVIQDSEGNKIALHSVR